SRGTKCQLLVVPARRLCRAGAPPCVSRWSGRMMSSPLAEVWDGRPVRDSAKETPGTESGQSSWLGDHHAAGKHHFAHVGFVQFHRVHSGLGLTEWHPHEIV